MAINQYVKYENFVMKCNQDMSGNHSDIKSPFDLDLWLSVFKIKRSHLLNMTNHYVKYEGYVMNSFQDNQRNHYVI
jgi:hypothetical protein